jgi:hypothetical protein
MKAFFFGFISALLIMSSTAIAGYNYVSVAGVTLTGNDGSLYGHIGKGWSDDSNAAEESAMSACGFVGCVVLQTNSGCIGTAYDNARVVYAASDPDVESSQAYVMNYCNSQSTSGGCTNWDTVCSDGYDSNP